MNGELRAGPLFASLDGADLVDIGWGGLEIASRILVTVRDPEWGTVAPALRSCVVEPGIRGFRVELEAVHDDGRIAFAWRGSIDGSVEGALTLAIEGVAERDFVFRRIGVCVLHPCRAYVGGTYRATDGTASVEGAFPPEVVPQLLRDGQLHPMIGAFTELDVRFPGGAGVAFAFEGERFELEDQRNWTDASFKTYPTPLAESEPRAMRAGERLSQKVSIRSVGPAPPVTVVEDVTTVRIGGSTGRTMPPIGLVDPGDPSLSPAHVRVDVDVESGRGIEELHDAAALGVPLEVALHIDDEASGVEGVATLLAELPLARVLVHLASGATIPGALVAYVRGRLGVAGGSVPFVGGTSSFFSELNRLPPDEVGVDAIAFGVSPTVHAADERSMMETLATQSEVARRARVLANDLPIVVSPVTLREHVGSPFADAWTVGSVAALANAGVASLTYEAATPSLGLLMGLRGTSLLDVTASVPERVAALAVESLVVVANLTAALQRTRVGDDVPEPLTPYEVRVVSTG